MTRGWWSTSTVEIYQYWPNNYATSFLSYFLNGNNPYDIVFKIISQQGNEGEKGDGVFSPPTWIVPNWQKIPRVSACCLNLTEKENNNFHSYLVPKHQNELMRTAHFLRKLAFYIPTHLSLCLPCPPCVYAFVQDWGVWYVQKLLEMSCLKSLL